MRPVPDSIGTAPIGVRLSPDGQTVYVANYLARNVVAVAAAAPLDAMRQSRQPALRVAADADVRQQQRLSGGRRASATIPAAACAPPTPTAARRRRASAQQDCVPIVLGQPVSTHHGRHRGRPAARRHPRRQDPLQHRRARRQPVEQRRARRRGAALQQSRRSPMPRCPGSVVSTAHDASYVTCSTCHADFGGQDGRTWDFSQFGASLRNTMDLRGRPGFSPGTCSNDSVRRSASSTPPAATATSAR